MPPPRRDLLRRGRYLQGVETATFHILTPYPGTRLFQKMVAEGRLLHTDWDQYDTRHAVFRPARLTPAELEAGYRRAYRDFYRWGSILSGARTKPDLVGQLRHLACASAWKKLEPLWDAVIRLRQVARCIPLLEATLDATRRPSDRASMPLSWAGRQLPES